MNQILSTENIKEKKKRKGPAEISSVAKFFSISILIFGIFIIGTASYSMYKDYQDSQTITKPTVNVSQTGEDTIVLKVLHDKALAKVTYSWKDDEVIDLNVNGRKNIEQEIEIPTGTNILKIYAQDVNGQEINFTNTYTREGEITLDVTKQEDGNNIIISATGKSELSYLTYRWDEEEETRIDINDVQIEHELEALKGTHTLTVIVVDINNNTQTKEMEIQGVTKPTLEVVVDETGDNFIVRMSDEQGLDKVEFIINEDKKYRVSLDGVTEHEFSYALEPGENRLNVTLYNINGVTTNKKVKFTK